MIQIFNRPSSSHVHTRLAREIAEALGPTLEDNLIQFVSHTEKSVDAIIEEISTDQKYQSITIAGFVINRSFIVNLVVVLISVSAGTYEMFLSS